MSKKEYSVMVSASTVIHSRHIDSRIITKIEYLDILNCEPHMQKFFAEIKLEKITRDKCKICKYFVMCKLPVFNYKDMTKKLHIKILQNIEEEYFKKYCNDVEKITNEEEMKNTFKKERFAFWIDEE